jgi:hypothetical protein
MTPAAEYGSGADAINVDINGERRQGRRYLNTSAIELQMHFNRKNSILFYANYVYLLVVTSEITASTMSGKLH